MRKHASFHGRLLITVLLLFALAFLLPAVSAGDARLYVLAAAVCGVLLLFPMIPGRMFSLDSPSLLLALILCAFSVLVYAPGDPDAAAAQGLRCLMGLLMMLPGAVLLRVFRPSPVSALPVAAGGLALLALPLVLPSLGFSLTEAALALLLFSVSAFLSVRSRLPALVLSLAGLAILLLRQDLPSAAIWGITFLLVFWAVDRSVLWSSLALIAHAGLLAAFLVFSPFSPESPADSSLSRLAAMGFIGSQTPPEKPPVPDRSLFLSLGDQYGLVLLLCLFLLLLALLLRSSSLAQSARKTFHAALALGVFLLLGLRTALYFLSLSGLLPLAPGNLPFLTDSLPDLAGQMFLLGFLSGVSARNQADLGEDSHLAMLAR